MVSTISIRKRSAFQRRMRRIIHEFLTEYETPKIVSIHSISYAVLLRIIQIIILIYSVVYLLIYERGYQKIDTSIISAVTLKVKGVGFILRANKERVVMDVADYIVPASENNAIFIMTSFNRHDQNRSYCPESYSLKEALCTTDLDCQKDAYIPNKNGRWTGRCLLNSRISIVNQTDNVTLSDVGLCEMEGWCPAETDLLPTRAIHGILNFTIFIKNFIEFPSFGVKHKNLVDDLTPCIYDPKNHKDCPIFTLDYIMNQAEKDQKERAAMLERGGVIRVKIEWDCNLDRHLRHCKPVYSFARLDIPFREKSFSLGYNFRYASNWKQDAIQRRTLTKAYGLRLIITVNGQAGRFHFITFTLNTGSLVGIFGLATFLCDIILLYLSKRAHFYRSHVFQDVYLHSHTSTNTNHRDESVQTSLDNSSTTPTSQGGISSYSSSSNGTADVLYTSKGRNVVTRPLTLIDRTYPFRDDPV